MDHSVCSLVCDATCVILYVLAKNCKNVKQSKDPLSAKPIVCIS